MATSGTAPLKLQMGQMAGLNQMTLQSSAGASVITLQFNLNLSLDVAEQQVREAINAGSNLLPANLTAPPVYNKVNPADAPVITMAVTSKTLSLVDLQDISETRIAQKLAQQQGVGRVSISGGERPAIRVQFYPAALSAYGFNIDDLRTTISNATLNNPKGGFDGLAQSSTITANDQLSSIEEYRNVFIAYRNGAPVRLSDVANIVRGAENTKLRAWANGERAIIINIRRQPGANVIAVTDAIKKLVPVLQAGLPPARPERSNVDGPLGRRRSDHRRISKAYIAAARRLSVCSGVGYSLRRQQACMLRFRPIMMTTFAAILGAIPLALGGGEGSEMHRPLGITIVGGLAVSQVLTLYTTPTIYLYMDRVRI